MCVALPAGWITEGESAFNAMSGSPPMSIRQQALRGIAKVQLERGDRKAALHQYERILGKALIGRGPPAEPWAHSEYAWLLFEDGNLEVRGLAEESNDSYSFGHGCCLRLAAQSWVHHAQLHVGAATRFCGAPLAVEGRWGWVLPRWQWPWLCSTACTACDHRTSFWPVPYHFSKPLLLLQLA